MTEIDPEIEGEVAEATAGTSLRIYTLGRFSLVREGTVLRYTRKAPSKPLLLLKVLIACGGRQVGAANIAAILWPDKDGDLAQQSFETTLHRLRKFLGRDDFLLLEDGRVTLNSEQVWVDAWAFERHLSELRLLMTRPAGDGTAASRFDMLASSVLRMYQGHFLARDDAACWMVSIQERLRNKYVHCLLDFGHYWEVRGQVHKAVACYRKGIEVDDLIETFYQRLMFCLQQTGREPEAIATYRQCRHVLSVVLGLQPTEHTNRLYRNLLDRQARRA
ncbi:MAG: bacterial transcriptional activator domain-containing protein [Pseudomonadota bacterium]